MNPPKKPTPAQRQALEDIERSGDPWARVRGAARHGGWHSVMSVLQRRGWADFKHERGWRLTEKGSAVLASAIIRAGLEAEQRRRR